MTTTDDFNPMSLAEITAATLKQPKDKVDPVWRDRIGTLDVGGGFRIKRTVAESSRQLKTRLNHAALATGRKLAWYPQTEKLADGKPASWIVKVSAINVSQDGAEASQEAQQTTNGQNTADSTSDTESSVGPRRGRS